MGGICVKGRDYEADLLQNCRAQVGCLKLSFRVSDYFCGDSFRTTKQKDAHFGTKILTQIFTQHSEQPSERRPENQGWKFLIAKFLVSETGCIHKGQHFVRGAAGPHKPAEADR